MYRLKNCPRCDYSESYLRVYKAAGSGMFSEDFFFHVKCIHCDYTSEGYSSEENAINAWNNLERNE